MSAFFASHTMKHIIYKGVGAFSRMKTAKWGVWPTVGGFEVADLKFNHHNPDRLITEDPPTHLKPFHRAFNELST